MTGKFMSKRSGSTASAPGGQHNLVIDSHRRHDFRIKIGWALRHLQCVTSGAILRFRRHSTVGRMAGKARCMPGGRRLEGPFLKPKCVACRGRRLRNVLLGRITLRLIGLMTYSAAFFGEASSRPTRPGRISKLLVTLDFRYDLDVLVMREPYRKVRRRRPPFRCRIEDLSRIREGVPGAVSRRGIRVANRADRWPCSLKKLLSVTIETRFVLGIFGYVRKRVLFRPDLFPIG